MRRASACNGRCRRSHPYEDWSDARAYDGTATILQPQAEPLYGGVSPHHLLGLLADHDASVARDVVRATWRARFADPDRDWHDALAAGVVTQSAAAMSDARLLPDAVSVTLSASRPQALSLLFRADPYVGDGRFANNAWLQELPRPFTKLTWDNPLLISPAYARRLGVGDGDHVVLSVGEESLALPAWIVPGQADDVAVATHRLRPPRCGHGWRARRLGRVSTDGPRWRAAAAQGRRQRDARLHRAS